jgi:BirA family biotin operon repressor/biotin-[acetyl-CoA-carboxylase] ligase
MYSKNRLIAGTRIIRLASVDSTNAELSRRVQQENLPEGTVVTAEYQTAGRGQAGNAWHAEPGKNLLFSLAIYPQGLEVKHQFYLSMAVVCAVQRVAARYINDCSVKWPNDIYAGDRKLGGILIENSLQGNAIRQSIIGIGLNVNQASFDPLLPNPASIFTCTGRLTSLDKLLEELLDELDGELLQLRARQFDSISTRYHRVLYKHLKPYLFEVNGEQTEGIIEGVAPTGELQVRINDAVETFQFKQIKYLFEWPS